MEGGVKTALPNSSLKLVIKTQRIDNDVIETLHVPRPSFPVSTSPLSLYFEVFQQPTSGAFGCKVVVSSRCGNDEKMLMQSVIIFLGRLATFLLKTRVWF